MIANIPTGKLLSLVTPGESSYIESFTDQRIANKLMSMGLLPGSIIRVIRKTPFGNTFYIKANNHQLLALRKQEAACIVLK